MLLTRMRTETSACVALWPHGPLPACSGVPRHAGSAPGGVWQALLPAGAGISQGRNVCDGALPGAGHGGGCRAPDPPVRPLCPGSHTQTYSKAAILGSPTCGSSGLAAAAEGGKRKGHVKELQGCLWAEGVFSLQGLALLVEDPQLHLHHPSLFFPLRPLGCAGPTPACSGGHTDWGAHPHGAQRAPLGQQARPLAGKLPWTANPWARAALVPPVRGPGRASWCSTKWMRLRTRSCCCPWLRTMGTCKASRGLLQVPFSLGYEAFCCPGRRAC